MANTETDVRFDGQVVLVTGAGRGLGRSHALAFGERGGLVVVHDAGVAQDGSGGDPAVADAVVEEIQQRGGQAVAAYENLATAGACRAIVERIEREQGRLDVLVHNAGLVRFAKLADTDEVLWRLLMAVNLEAPVWISQAALPLMARRGYGRIVVTISGHGLFPSYDVHDVAAYSMTKAALFGLTNQLAAEGAPHGITANAISPVAATRIYRTQVEPGTVTPEQITPGVLYLASERCQMNGMVLRAADGRFQAGWFCRTDGVDFGREPATPEQIEARWGEITAGPLQPLG